ncbi:glycosyltransferase [Cellulomonas sp.]|uniref:glycosyltransferase n=1 Tax=Cellulomonas sp. TaxID=40001 RepID=UPI00281134DD|nr:glycosyltransferase [Cellulomonas sp.]
MEALGHERPLLLGVAPVARGNPYQALLYHSFAEEGIATVALNRAQSFTALGDLAGDHPVVAHLHWLSFVLGSATDPRDAAQTLRRFETDVDEFLASGGRLVWTVHNRLPHDARFVDLEVELRNLVSARADVVHVMSRATPAAVADTVSIDPAKVVLAPHPSYTTSYPSYVTRVEARRVLGIEPDEVVYVLFGAVKPYKGLERLLPALDALRARGVPARLLIAGQADDTDVTRAFVERCLVHPHVLVNDKRVPTEHAQYYLRAADVGLAPYERVLNSGAAMLYATFGLPVVVPDQPTVREPLLDEGHVAFASGDTGSLVAAMERAAEIASGELSASIAEHVGQFDPEHVSRALARELRGRLSS